jgi:fructose-1,6-bisphosphatase/inositol monophosphatase family enzyme
MDFAVHLAVRDAALELADLLRNRQPLENIEKTLSERLFETVNCSLFISGRNRISESGANIVRQAKNGRYVVILNIVDGHVNYLRGSRLFGGSVSVLDTLTGNRSAMVYNGLDDQLLEFPCPNDNWNKGPHLPISPHPVLGLCQFVPLNETFFKVIPMFSLRSLGSTTLSILEVLTERIDAYLCKTKLWNFHWALTLCKQTSLSIVLGLEQKPVTTFEEELLKYPERSVVLLCYMKEEIAQRLSSVLKSIVEYYETSHQEKVHDK